MKFNDIIKLNIEKGDVIEAIEKAKRHQFLDNLRRRSPIVAFDSKVRGYLGEIAIKKWLIDHGVTDFRTRGLDEHSCDVDLDIILNNTDISCEIKTSKIPDSIGTLEKVVNSCDIKIIKRNDFIMADRDVYIQIYYNLLTKVHDKVLIYRYSETGVGADSNAELIYETYSYWRYLDNTFFVAWDHKSNIEDRLLSLPEDKRTYSISMRTFYSCPIRCSCEPDQIIEYIKNYNR